MNYKWISHRMNDLASTCLALLLVKDLVTHVLYWLDNCLRCTTWSNHYCCVTSINIHWKPFVYTHTHTHTHTHNNGVSVCECVCVSVCVCVCMCNINLSFASVVIFIPIACTICEISPCESSYPWLYGIDDCDYY